MTKKIDKTLKLIDKIIKLDYEKMECEKKLRLCLTVKKHFPADIVKGHKFFAISRKEYQKGYMFGYRHTPLEIPKAGMFKNRRKKDEKGYEDILIMCIETKEWVELPHFELPISDKKVFSFAREPKKAMAYEL